MVDPKKAVNLKKGTRSWSRRVDINMAFYLTLMAVFIGANVYFQQQGSSPPEVIAYLNSTTNMTQEAVDNYLAVWQAFTIPGLPGQFMQFTSVHLQLMIIVGLCLDQGGSVTGDLFRTKLMQFFGRISMAVYLVHYPLILWLLLAIHGGPVEWVEGGDEINGYRRMNPLGFHDYLPGWAIPINFTVSIIIGYLLTLLVEDPARKLLQRIYTKCSTEKKDET